MEPMKPMEPMQPMDFGPRWWPEALGEPGTSGGQNDLKYAFFPGAHRLAVQRNGQVTIYDSADHDISDVSQRHGAAGDGGADSLAFVSQHGTVDLSQLKQAE